MNEQIAKLNKKLLKIKGDDPISRARKAALIAEICRLMEKQQQAEG